MKTRQGFVSNSSSTSFICVCTEFMLDEFLEKVGYEKGDMSEGAAFLDDDLVIYANKYEPSFYGLNIEEYLKNDEVVSSLKIKFKELVLKKTGIDIHLDKIEFDYGEAGSG